MNLTKTTLVSVMMCLMMAFSAYSAEGKIGMVDFQKVLATSNAGKAAKEQITKEGKKMEDDLKGRVDEIEELRKKFEKESPVMSKEARDEKQRDIRIKAGDIQSLQKKYADEFKTFEGKLIKQIQKDVFDIVEDIGKKDGYTMIIEKGAGLICAGVG
ncbi:MAG: OmpH family outer membrane protein [Desulfobacteraceae bacterium]|nr:OmpH family outer membrane protein [Desulfobacteraceae bacterium]